MLIEPLEILVVEDNDDDIVMIREALDGAHMINLLQVVRDGEEALAYLRREGKYRDAPRPGLVLLDINMPKKNGFEVLTDMKADESLRAIPVVVLTTSTREEDVIRCYANGACTFISKPVDFEKLQQVANHFSLYWVLTARVPSPKG